jgi:hypothetical protein
MKHLAIALLLCSGPAWGQSAERSMLWHDLAFRTGFKAEMARACAELTATEFASIQAEFATETGQLQLSYGDGYAKMLSVSFNAGIDMARRSFARQGQDLCAQWAPGDLEKLRAIVAGAGMVLPR